MRLTTAIFAKDDIVLGILGITEQDVAEFKMGATVEAIDLRRNFALGRPVPNMLQIIYVKDDQDYEDRLRAVGFDPDNIVPVPEDNG